MNFITYFSAEILSPVNDDDLLKQTFTRFSKFFFHRKLEQTFSAQRNYFLYFVRQSNLLNFSKRENSNQLETQAVGLVKNYHRMSSHGS